MLPLRLVDQNLLLKILWDMHTYMYQSSFQVRALVEGQFLSMRAHAERFGMPLPPKRIIATGGASANECILNAMASIFGCNVYKIQSSGK